jgi:hypothetical protein
MLKKTTRGTAALLSVLIAVILLLITLDNPSFFVFNPFETGFSILGFAQLIAIASWFLLLCGPVFILLSKVELVGAWWALFLVSVLAWPVSVFMIRVIVFTQFSDAHFDYLIKTSQICCYARPAGAIKTVVACLNPTWAFLELLNSIASFSHFGNGPLTHACRLPASPKDAFDALPASVELLFKLKDEDDESKLRISIASRNANSTLDAGKNEKNTQRLTKDIKYRLKSARGRVVLIHRRNNPVC